MNRKRLMCTFAAVLVVSAACAQNQTAQNQNSPTTQTERERSILLPPGESYRLMPGDSITVNFRFTPEFNDDLVIGPDGHVMLKSAGNVRLAGLSLPEAQQEIIQASASKLVNPEVTVSLKDFDKPHVVVAGEVLTPGRFDLRKPTTALQAILMAGGPKQDGAMGRVLLFRKLNSEIAEVHVLQLGDFTGKKRSKQDMLLQPDDMILVRQDNLSKIERYVKLINLGVYFDPLNNLVF